MRDWRLWLALTGLGVGGYLFSSQLLGGGSAPVSADELTTQVYVCRDTGELFVGKAHATPAARPDNGKETLLTGWYCGKCRTWHSGPSLAEWQRRPLPVKCPRTKTKTPLEPTGPLPEQAKTL